MRFHNSETLELEYFDEWRNPEEYAIVSHRWTDEEVTYEDVIARPVTKDRMGESKGIDKIIQASELALKDGLKHFWIDTSMSPYNSWLQD